MFCRRLSGTTYGGTDETPHSSREPGLGYFYSNLVNDQRTTNTKPLRAFIRATLCVYDDLWMSHKGHPINLKCSRKWNLPGGIRETRLQVSRKLT